MRFTFTIILIQFDLRIVGLVPLVMEQYAYHETVWSRLWQEGMKLQENWKIHLETK